MSSEHFIVVNKKGSGYLIFNGKAPVCIKLALLVLSLFGDQLFASEFGRWLLVLV